MAETSIELSVYSVPELSTKARVGNSGDVYLPLIDYVHVAELTVEEAQALIEKRLSVAPRLCPQSACDHLRRRNQRPQGVTVLGEVTKPGIYPSLGDHKSYRNHFGGGRIMATAGRNVSVCRSQPEPIRLSPAQESGGRSE